jgi:hypothetical protein
MFIGTHPFSFVTSEKDNVGIWYPLSKLSRPVLKGAFGNDHQMRAGNSSMILEITQEGDSL